MGQAIGAAAGGLTGLLSGALANQKEGGTDTGNVWGSTLNALGGPGGAGNTLRDMSQQQTAYKGDPTASLQNNSVLGGLFGKGGTMDRTGAEEQQLAGSGYALTPEDHTAYGQASGDIARMFGQSDQSLSQALADRGLSNSGVAGAAFSGSHGNKQEQLAGLQTKIANDRMNMNMQRLGQTRQFLSQLGNQAQSGINQEQQLGRQQAQDQNQANMNRFNMVSGLMGNYQDQQNTGLQQQQQTQHGSTLSNAFNGMASGAMKGMSAGSGGGGGAGGMSGLMG